MRDIALMIVLPILLYTGFKRPFIGLGLWLWSSAFNINAIVFGFAASITYAKLFSGLTFISCIVSKEKFKLKFDTLTWFIILFYIVVCLSCISPIGNVDWVWEKWGNFSKIIVFYFFAIAIMNKKIHFDLLIWTLIISIGALASKEGVKFLVTGGGHKIDSVAGISADNNFFGVMIITVIPLASYIYTQIDHKLLKNGVMAVIVFMILGIFATYSRGAFLGLAVCAIFFWKSSNSKILWLILLIAIVFAMNNLMPDAWMSRMNTVETADTDTSFMGRVMAWKIAILVAMDNVFGGSFSCVEQGITWRTYVPQFYKVDFITTPEPPQGLILATHSLYFQVLSNHGFLGLFLFLMILLTGYLKSSFIISAALNNNLPNWIVELAKMLRLSLISYCVSGAAVNVAYFDFLYAIFAIIVVLDAKVVSVMVAESQQAKIKPKSSRAAMKNDVIH